jgi:transglutaminase-like putative cysteine protease
MVRLFFALAFTASLAAQSKTFDATYTATLSDIPAGTEKIDVWIPLPSSGEYQSVEHVKIDSPYEFTRYREAAWGNEYAHATIANPPASLAVKVTFRVTRSEAKYDAVKGSLGDRDQALRANRLVTLSPRVRALADEVTAGKTNVTEQARAIYDHLLATMTYDKVAPGWGQGDTERACDIRKGNCTDFHSLFLSLARAKGIPSRFVIGFPMTAAEGVVKGYHCWAEYWDGRGWVPVDASDASKNPKLAEYLFGNLDPNRMQFTVGRDIVLTPATAEPLNYFIYPRGEVKGVVTGVPTITLEFRPIPPGTTGS